MNTLAEMVQTQLLAAIKNDDLVLPTLPEVAMSIREAAEDSDISVNTLSKVIGRDAALAARLIKVVNSPLLRAVSEVTDLQTAITRLGINYSCNLAIGLVIEQIFHARSDVIEQKMREIWAKSLEIAGISYELCSRFTELKPDQAALAGLVHQIGVLPILTYAEEHNELLSDPVCLNHVIEQIHPVLGDKILRVWEFPEQLTGLPGELQNLERRSSELDYIDIVQIARALSDSDGQEKPASALPAFQHLHLPAGNPLQAEELLDAQRMFH